MDSFAIALIVSGILFMLAIMQLMAVFFGKTTVGRTVM